MSEIQHFNYLPPNSLHILAIGVWLLSDIAEAMSDSVCQIQFDKACVHC